MPILVQCECGHEVTVADSMEGKKGRCPKCDAVLTIPERRSRRPRGGAFTRPPRERPVSSFGSLRWLSWLLGILALLCLFGFAGIGVYTGVTAFRAGEAFRGPFGLFSQYAAAARESPIAVGCGFIVGGFLLGGLSALVLSAVGQTFRLFVSLERSLESIADHLAEKP